VPLHTHRCGGAAYLISWSDFIRRDQDGNVLADSRYLSPPQTVPCVQWTDPLPPHSVENVGGSVLSILMVELKSTGVVGQSAVPENAGRRGWNCAIVGGTESPRPASAEVRASRWRSKTRR
jgi:hypothetical protein